MVKLREKRPTSEEFGFNGMDDAIMADMPNRLPIFGDKARTLLRVVRIGSLEGISIVNIIYHYCPVISRIKTTGYKVGLIRFGGRTS